MVENIGKNEMGTPKRVSNFPIFSNIFHFFLTLGGLAAAFRRTQRPGQSLHMKMSRKIKTPVSNYVNLRMLILLLHQSQNASPTITWYVLLPLRYQVISKNDGCYAMWQKTNKKHT